MVYQNDLSPDNMLNDKETQNAEENAQLQQVTDKLDHVRYKSCRPLLWLDMLSLSVLFYCYAIRLYKWSSILEYEVTATFTH